MKERSARITLYDVAAMAGVSKSTVSRVLHGTDRGDEATGERVRRAAVQLGYVRDMSAANLRRGNTGTIGLIVTRLTDAVMATFHEQVVKACAVTGRFAIVAGTDGTHGSDRRAAETLLARGVDGLIVATARLDDDFPVALARRGVRFVLALRKDSRSAAVVGDDALGGYLATRHLLDLGHRHVAMIAGPSNISSAESRLAGYRRALAEAGVADRAEWIVRSGAGYDAGEQAVTRLMSLEHRPTAIFAVNDAIAIGALSALARLGLTVPRDVSLVGYSDIEIVRHLTVPLTTVRVPYERIAIDALDILDTATLGEGGVTRILPPILVARASTAARRD